jgi:hypothetical protein
MRWKKKITTLKTSTTKKARQAYGPEAIDITGDVSQSDLDQLQQSFIENHVNLSAQQCKTIILHLPFNNLTQVFGPQKERKELLLQMLVQLSKGTRLYPFKN